MDDCNRRCPQEDIRARRVHNEFIIRQEERTTAYQARHSLDPGSQLTMVPNPPVQTHSPPDT